MSMDVYGFLNHGLNSKIAFLEAIRALSKMCGKIQVTHIQAKTSPFQAGPNLFQYTNPSNTDMSNAIHEAKSTNKQYIYEVVLDIRPLNEEKFLEYYDDLGASGYISMTQMKQLRNTKTTT